MLKRPISEETNSTNLSPSDTDTANKSVDETTTTIPSTLSIPVAATPAIPSTTSSSSPTATRPTASPKGASIDELIAKAKAKGAVGTQTEGTCPADVVSDIMVTIGKIIGMPDSHITEESLNAIMLTTAVLFQKGATSVKAKQSLSCDSFGYGQVTNGVLQQAILKVAKERNLVIRPRQVARAMAPLILKVSKELNIAGNLSKSFIQDNPNYNRDDLVYASDIFTFVTDGSIPDEISTWLISNYKKRFGKTQA